MQTMSGVVLQGADFSKSNLSGAQMARADARGANLSGVDFTDTNAYGTQVGAVGHVTVGGRLMLQPGSTAGYWLKTACIPVSASRWDAGGLILGWERQHVGEAHPKWGIVSLEGLALGGAVKQDGGGNAAHVAAAYPCLPPGDYSTQSAVTCELGSV
jgi:uncharacterized protein YjbI with pentapeptide repeats